MHPTNVYLSKDRSNRGRRVFYVDVGKLSRREAGAYLTTVTNTHRAAVGLEPIKPAQPLRALAMWFSAYF